MHLIIKPRRELLGQAKERVRRCRMGFMSESMGLDLFVAEGGISFEEMGTNETEWRAWHTEAMKGNYDS